MADPCRCLETSRRWHRERVRGLSADARLASLAAAALSRPTRALIVRAVASEGAAADDLLETEEAGVLVVEGDKVRFTHPLLAAAIYGTATSERRRRMHERLGEVVSDARGASPPPRPEHDLAGRGGRRRARARCRPGGAAGRAAGCLGALRQRAPADARGSLEGARATRARRRMPRCARLATSRVHELSPRESPDAAAGRLRARALLVLGDIAWIRGRPGAIEQLELALEAAEGDPDLVASIYPKLVNVSIAVDPPGTIERARSTVETLDPERDPAALASVYLDWAWAETLRGNGEQPELLERWRACEERARA